MTSAVKNKEDYSVNHLTTDQMRQKFDHLVMEQLGINAEKFIQNYRDGIYDDRDDCDIMSLLMMIPFTGYSQQYGKKQNSCGK